MVTKNQSTKMNKCPIQIPGSFQQSKAHLRLNQSRRIPHFHKAVEEKETKRLAMLRGYKVCLSIKCTFDSKGSSGRWVRHTATSSSEIQQSAAHLAVCVELRRKMNCRRGEQSSVWPRGYQPCGLSNLFKIATRQKNCLSPLSLIYLKYCSSIFRPWDKHLAECGVC